MKAVKSNTESVSQNTSLRTRKNEERDFFGHSSREGVFLNRDFIQPKLKIGQPDDEYEREADHVADTVMRMPNPQPQMQPLEEDEEQLQMKVEREDRMQMKCKECKHKEKLYAKPLDTATIIQKQDEPSGAASGTSGETETTTEEQPPEEDIPNITIELPSPLTIRVNGVMYSSPTFLVEGPNGQIVDIAPYTGNGMIDFPLAALESLGIPALSFYHFHYGRARQYLGRHFESAYALSGGTSFIRNALHYGYITADDVTLFGAPSSYDLEHYGGIPHLNIVANPMDIGTMINVSYFNYPLREGGNNPAVLFSITAPFDQNPFDAFINLGGAFSHALSGDLYNLPGVTHSYPRFQNEPDEAIGTPTTTTQVSPKMESDTGAPPVIESQLEVQKGTGHSLPYSTRNFMEKGIGADFSSVQIHTGPQAIQLSKDLGAQAFTVGTDIFFNRGKWNPSSYSGKHLLAHELTHVVQQSSKNQLHPSIIQREQVLDEPGRFENVHRNLFTNISGNRQPWQGEESADQIFQEFKTNFPEQPALQVPQRTTENQAETDAIVVDQRIRDTFSEITSPVSESRLRDAVQIMDNSFFSDEEFRRAWLANKMIQYTEIEDFDIDEEDPRYHALQDRLFNDSDVSDDIENKMRLQSAFARGNTPANREIFLHEGISATQRKLTLIHEIIHFYTHPQYKEWIKQSTADRVYTEGLTEYFARQVMTSTELTDRDNYQERVDDVQNEILRFASESDVRLAFFQGEVWRLEHTFDEAKEAFGDQIGIQSDATRSEERAQSNSSPGINQTVEQNRHYRFMNIGIEQPDPKPEHIAFFQSIFDDIIQNNPDMRLRFVGHTSSSGRIRYNRALSRRRVLAFYQMARDAGVPENQLINPGNPEFEGEISETARNDSVIGRAMNRRVELYLVPPHSTELEDNIFHLERLRGEGVGEGGVRVEYDLASVIRNSANPDARLPFIPTGWNADAIMTELGQYDIIGGTDSDSLRCVQAVAMTSYIPAGPDAVVHYLDIMVQDARRTRRMNRRRRKAIEVINFVKEKINNRTATFGDLSWAQEAVHDLFYDDVSGTDESDIIAQISPGLDSTRSVQTLDVWTSSSTELMSPVQELQPGEQLIVTVWKVFFDDAYEQLRAQGTPTSSPMDVNIGGSVVTINELNPTSRPAHTSFDENRDNKKGHQLLIFRDNSNRLWLYEPELHEQSQHLFEITDESIFDQYFTELVSIEVYEYVQIIGKITPEVPAETP